jgi:dipeptidyl aminopeptidase/acylaminoacyl peptidase
MWSPDGAWVLFNTATGDSASFLNRELAQVPARGGGYRVLTDGFDENPSAVAWKPAGIYFLASRRTARHLYLLNPDTGETHRVLASPEMIWSADFSADGRTVALLAEDRTQLTEVYRTTLEPYEPVPVTRMTDQVAGWPLGTREVVAWTSEDGAAIEGVLFKPPDYDPGRRYPLLVVIHGGPTGTSRPQLVSGYVYPVLQWLAQGAVVLMPNYRGSAGYGEAFRSLNVRNLGVGDAWDVLSGVEHLVREGIAHPDSLGAMGWSQGGYISAFLTTTTDRFKAISVGAGNSNWMTYYVNTDIHPFTRHYLQGTPWSDAEVYAKTSPKTYIHQARTPTLIQHGEFDRRVPIPNAYELLQGLRDVGVPARLVVYKGFGHGINKPKERLAATWHNWQWFSRYIWGREVELPLE